MLTLGEWPLMPAAAAPSDYSSGTVGNLGVDSDRTHETTVAGLPIQSASCSSHRGCRQVRGLAETVEVNTTQQ